MGQLRTALEKILPPERLCEREPMRQHTTFRTGGEASYFLRINTREELSAVINTLQEPDVPWIVLGRGSNVLVSDLGYDGAILQLTGEFEEIRQTAAQELTVGAGAALGQVALSAQKLGLTGLEFASGIPGSIGGALIMNAGAFGGEMAQICTGASVLDEEVRLLTLDRDAMAFGYRTSSVKGTHRIILSATLQLQQSSPEEIAARMEELKNRRLEKQPLEYSSAGSTFKRPAIEGYYAGKLIEEAGLRGFAIGDAQVSEKHCGFIINRGAATSAEVYQLICEVQRRVEASSGIRLEPEVLTLGVF